MNALEEGLVNAVKGVMSVLEEGLVNAVDVDVALKVAGLSRMGGSC